MNTYPMPMTDEIIQQFIQSTSLPTVMDFWAEWCPPCKQVNIWMQHIAEQYLNRLVVVTVNIDENPLILDLFTVQGVPTILLFRDGKLVHRQKDELTEADLKLLIEQHIL